MKCAYHTKWYDKWQCGGANHPHYGVISTPTTPFGMVCILHFYSVHNQYQSVPVYTSVHHNRVAMARGI